jgi:hypothetical protein
MLTGGTSRCSERPENLIQSELQSVLRSGPATPAGQDQADSHPSRLLAEVATQTVDSALRRSDRGIIEERLTLTLVARCDMPLRMGIEADRDSPKLHPRAAIVRPVRGEVSRKPGLVAWLSD